MPHGPLVQALGDRLLELLGGAAGLRKIVHLDQDHGPREQGPLQVRLGSRFASDTDGQIRSPGGFLTASLEGVDVAQAGMHSGYPTLFSHHLRQLQSLLQLRLGQSQLAAGDEVVG